LRAAADAISIFGKIASHLSGARNDSPVDDLKKEALNLGLKNPWTHSEEIHAKSNDFGDWRTSG
jgi:hypothetical protein